MVAETWGLVSPTSFFLGAVTACVKVLLSQICFSKNLRRSSWRP